MLLHDFEFGLFGISNDFLDYVFDGLDKIFKFHLVGIRLFPHDFDEDEMVIIFSDFLIGHSCELWQFSELGGGKDPLRPDAALTVEYFEHVFDDVHFFDILTFDI